MEIIPRGALRALTPADNLWLYNSKLKLFRKEVFLGIGDDGSAWSEVTEAEKLELEKAFENEIPVDQNEATTETEQKAQAYDIITGGGE